MNLNLLVMFAATALATALAAAPAPGQPHIATRLGHPSTRFSDPLKTPDDLRALFRSEALRADVNYIARESGFHGDMEDLRRAAATGRILPLEIPVGKRLPAMSSRRNGKPVLLREVLWAGKEPIDAYEFFFVSKGRRYRVVTPKACANFWVEDQGRDLNPVLALRCEVPAEVALGRQIRICLSLENRGEAPEPSATVTLPVPSGAVLVNATHGGRVAEGRVVWNCGELAAGTARQICAVFELPRLGPASFVASARGVRSPAVESRCLSRVIGVPALMLEVVDLNDPIEVGASQTYDITVLNQGSAPLTNLRVTCRPDERQEFLAGSGPTTVSASGRTIFLETLPVLGPKGKAVWRVSVRALSAGDARFTTELECDQFRQPITESEATQQY